MPIQLPFQVENYILNVKREHTSWGARKIRERLMRRFSGIKIPAKSTIHAVLDRLRHGGTTRPLASAPAKEPLYPWATVPTNSGVPIMKASSCRQSGGIVIR